MPDQTFFQVVTILAAPEPIYKSRDYYKPYTVPVRYQLADGREIPATHQYKRLRDAKAFQALLPMRPELSIKVSLTEAGEIAMSHKECVIMAHH